MGFSHIFVLLSCGFTPTGEQYLFVDFSTVGKSLPLIILLTYNLSMSSGRFSAPVSNQGMKSDFMGFREKTTRVEQIRKRPSVFGQGRTTQLATNLP